MPNSQVHFAVTFLSVFPPEFPSGTSAELNYQPLDGWQAKWYEPNDNLTNADQYAYRFNEQRIWALKSDWTHLGTVQRLSLLELEGRLKALNGWGTYRHVPTNTAAYTYLEHTTDCTYIWSRLPSPSHDSWGRASLICTVAVVAAAQAI